MCRHPYWKKIRTRIIKKTKGSVFVIIWKPQIFTSHCIKFLGILMTQKKLILLRYVRWPSSWAKTFVCLKTSTPSNCSNVIMLLIPAGVLKQECINFHEIMIQWTCQWQGHRRSYAWGSYEWLKDFIFRTIMFQLSLASHQRSIWCVWIWGSVSQVDHWSEGVGFWKSSKSERWNARLG